MIHIFVWNGECQVLIVWSLMNHDSDMVTRAQVWESMRHYCHSAGNLKCPLYPDDTSGSVLTEQCAGLWLVTQDKHWFLIGHSGQTLASHWSVVWWIVFTLGTKVKMMSFKMFGWKIFIMNTWVWRSVNLILIQFPGPAIYCLPDVSPLLTGADTNHFN